MTVHLEVEAEVGKKAGTSDNQFDRERSGTTCTTNQEVNDTSAIDVKPKPGYDAPGTAGFFSSMINFVMTMIGMGLTIIPWSFSQCGLIPGIVMVIVCGILTAHCMCLLVKVTVTSRMDSYEDSARFFMGRAGFIIVSLMVFIDLMLGSFGCVISFIELLGEHEAGKIQGLVRQLASCNEGECDWLIKPFFGAIASILLLPTFGLKTLNKLTHVSTVAALSLIICFLMLVIIYPIFIGNEDFTDRNPSKPCLDNCQKYGDKFAYCDVNAESGKKTCICGPGHFGDSCAPPYKAISDDVVWIVWDWIGFANAFGVILLSYYAHFQVFVLYNELKDRENATKIINFVIYFFAIPGYIIFGLIGYALFGNEASDAVIFKNVPGVFGMTATFIIATCNLAKTPIFVNACRNVIVNSLSIQDKFISRFLISGVITFLCCLVGPYLSISEVVILCGISSGTLLGYVTPGLFVVQYIRSYGLDLQKKSALDWKYDDNEFVEEGPIEEKSNQSTKTLSILDVLNPFSSGFNRLPRKSKLMLMSGCMIGFFGAICGVYSASGFVVDMVHTHSA